MTKHSFDDPPSMQIRKVATPQGLPRVICGGSIAVTGSGGSETLNPGLSLPTQRGARKAANMLALIILIIALMSAAVGFAVCWSIKGAATRWCAHCGGAVRCPNCLGGKQTVVSRRFV